MRSRGMLIFAALSGFLFVAILIAYVCRLGSWKWPG
ncbi:hypothetical protein SODG_001404 [Sodalis praecaptivus]|nr:hypothetical protein NVIRENTERO_03855 [Sodalis praecaptivus]